jgi:prepilin-type N-terminal cleavage/methylation domain-containing protein
MIRLRRHGFTLVETLAAVVILGLLVGLAAWSFAGPLRRARLEQAVEQIRFVDASTRQLGRDTGGSFRISIDAERAAVGRVDSSNRRAEHSLPAGVRIERVRTASGDHGVDVSRLGLSESYAVLLVGAQWRRWVFVSGLSGEVRVIPDDGSIEQILSQTTARRDAD